MVIGAALVLATGAFMLSASAGFGGSLILVPGLSLLLGVKQGIALAAIMLAANNVAKAVTYRHTVPLRSALWIMVLTVIGAALGAKLLVAAPEQWISIAVITSFIAALALERMQLRRAQGVAAPALAFGAGATSGFSGTSGPLKGIALRNLHLDRLHFVGAAAIVSLVNDATKSAIYAEASLFDKEGLLILLLALPLMPLATLAGRQTNRAIGERAFTYLFWAVMTAYAARLILLW